MCNRSDPRESPVDSSQKTKQGFWDVVPNSGTRDSFFWLGNLKQGETNTSLYFISSSSGLWWSLLIIYWIRKQKWHFHWKMRNCHFQHAITTSPWCNDHLIGRLTDARPPPPSLSHLGQSLKNNKVFLRLPSTPCLDYSFFLDNASQWKSCLQKNHIAPLNVSNPLSLLSCHLTY